MDATKANDVNKEREKNMLSDLDMVMVNLAKLILKASGDHENFQTLYAAWKRCEAELKEIGRESCLQEQQGIKDVKIPKPIRERYLLQSAPLIKAVGNAQPKKTQCSA